MSIVLLSVASVFAQEPQPKAQCIAAGEKLYQPGAEGVKPPKLQISKVGEREKGKLLPVASFDLVINNEGRICSIEIISAADEGKGREAAQYIAEHWSFKPATKKGEPVPVKMRVNFHPN